MSSERTTVVTPGLLRDWPLPEPDGDKHSRGTVVVIGGGAATPGAVLLAGTAALRAGSGVLQIQCSPQVATAVAVQMPEARVTGWSVADGVDHAAAVAIGPGLDDMEQTGALLRSVAGAAGPALVIDAYALAALAKQPELLHGRTTPSVLTPNGTEAAILLGRDQIDDPAAAAITIARRYQAVTALRGHIATPDGRRWREEGGDTGLGTSGSGDVLAGLIAGLIARGASADQACCWGTHLHAMAGQRLAARCGRTGFLARELPAEAAAGLAALMA